MKTNLITIFMAAALAFISLVICFFLLTFFGADRMQ